MFRQPIPRIITNKFDAEKIESVTKRSLSLCREKARTKFTYEERERENVAEKTLRIYTIPQALSSQSTTTTSISDSNSRKIAGNARQCWIISPELLVNGEQLLLLQLLSLTFSLLILR
uniref:Uncharacterized protein n=1 Tax=Opuntia streptacantha TaxID=393608 RepID=A0A7C9CXI6_OPUST